MSLYKELKNIKLQLVNSSSAVFNTVSVDGDLAVNGGDLTSTATNFRMLDGVAGSISIGQSTTTVNIGKNTGTTTIRGDLYTSGDLTVDGISYFPSASVTEMTASKVSITNTLICSGNVKMRGGYGIDFAASADEAVAGASVTAEVLDDYEEGTWTPAYEGESTAGTISYTGQTGYYTKIGRKVFVQGVIIVGTEASTAGNLRITGLPFTIQNSTLNYPSFYVSTFFNWDASLAAYAINLEGQINTNYIHVFKVTAASNTQGTRAQGSDLAATGNNITFSGFYFTST